MKDKDLKNFKPNGGIRPSPLKVHNELIANILQSSSLSNGTIFSLYDALVELCKEFFSASIPHIDFISGNTHPFPYKL